MKKTAVNFLWLFTFILTVNNFAFAFNVNNSVAKVNPIELAQLLEQKGIFSNLIEATIIPASEVKDNLRNSKYLFIDIRSESWFDYGHIKNAQNVPANNLLNYFKTKIIPTKYDKIVIICYSGQSAAYYSALLRIAGFNNVFSMNWGMSSWRVDFAENSWLKNVKTKPDYSYEQINNPVKNIANLISSTNEANQKTLNNHILKQFETPYRTHIANSDDIFKNPEKYHVIYCGNSESFSNGHIKGAYYFKSLKDFSLSANLNSIPIDKTIVIYSETGQVAAKIVAYLNVLGYNVKNIAYGENSFKNKTLKEHHWKGFSKKNIHMYPVIE